MSTIELRCSDHPTYRGIRPPKVKDCKCPLIYLAAQSGILSIFAEYAEELLVQELRHRDSHD